MGRKRNKKDKILKMGRHKKAHISLLAKMSLGELDIRDSGFLPHVGNWGEVVSPTTGIKYKVLIGDIKRVR